MDPVVIAQEGVEKFKKDGFEIIIVDTRCVGVVGEGGRGRKVFEIMFASGGRGGRERRKDCNRERRREWEEEG
jgi:hypothetical protein